MTRSRVSYILFLLTAGRWWCSRDNTCLKYTQMCDGVDHCPRPNKKGLDERAAICRTIQCTGSYTRCGRGSLQCVKVNSVCDGEEDCLNGWDERSCNVSSADCSLTDEYESYPSATIVRELNGEVVCMAALDTHNVIRAYHRGTKDVRYDVDLARSAEERAMTFAHNFALGVSAFDAEQLGYKVDIGELSHYGIQVDDEINSYISQAIYQWYNVTKSCRYNYDTGSYNTDCYMTSFKQVIWAESVFIGCGAASAPLVFDDEYGLSPSEMQFLQQLTNARLIFLVCHYLVKSDDMIVDGYVKPLKDDADYPLMPEYPELA